MKPFYIVIWIFLLANLHAGIGSEIVEVLPKYFSRTSRQLLTKDGDEALILLGKHYGTAASDRLRMLRLRYGEQGIETMLRYGDEAVLASRDAYRLVSRYGDRGYYLLKQYPSAAAHFGRFGERYIEATKHFGAERITRWLDDMVGTPGVSERFFSLLDEYGSRAVEVWAKHWGKILASGFVLLNADTIINGGVTVVNTGLHEGGESLRFGTQKVVEAFSQSHLVDYLGLGFLGYLLLGFFFKLRTKHSEY